MHRAGFETPKLTELRITEKGEFLDSRSCTAMMRSAVVLEVENLEGDDALYRWRPQFSGASVVDRFRFLSIGSAVRVVESADEEEEEEALYWPLCGMAFHVHSHR